MNPWSVLGWIVLTGCAIIAAIFLIIAGLFLLGALRSFAVRRWRYYMTRNTPPATGQQWDQNGKVMHIRICDNGRIGCKIGDNTCSISWSDSPEEWRNRVRGRKLFLISQTGGDA